MIDKGKILISTIGLGSLLLLLLVTAYSNESRDELKKSVSKKIEFSEDFDMGIFNPAKWQITREADFKESIIDVYDVNPAEDIFDYKLRLKANTIGTSDDTVKFHGVRNLYKIDFKERQRITFDLDWNKQSNGSYLAAAVYICPTVTNGNPSKERDCLKFEYVGVPPGRNARSVVAAKINGKLRQLDMDGWPEQRQGRYISYQHIEMILDSNALTIMENNRELFSTQAHGLTFSAGYLYLQMSSHSNYPARYIYFDNIK